jgi:hypothetical protein
MPKRTTEIGYFKPGYELVPKQEEFADPIKMRPFSGDMKRRFTPGFGGDYNVLNARAGCPQLGKKLYPLLLAIHSDAIQLAKTYEERSRVIGFEYLLDIIQKESVNGESIYDEPAIIRTQAKQSQLKREMGIIK